MSRPREFTASEDHLKESVDDWISEGDIGPWINVVLLEDWRNVKNKADKLAESLDECAHIIKGAFGNSHPSYIDAMKVLREYRGEK